MSSPILTDLSQELLCNILKYLPLKDVLGMGMQCRKLRDAVDLHLHLLRSLDLCEGTIHGHMPSSITDDHLYALLSRCPRLKKLFGLHPAEVERRRLRKHSALTVPGVLEALRLCSELTSVETSDLRLLEALLHHLPQLQVEGRFRNTHPAFPPHPQQRLKLKPNARISALHLIGVEVPELLYLPHLEHLHLECVRFTKLNPFGPFLAENLKTFVMRHCSGPQIALRYLTLIVALSSSPRLSRLELVRIPLPGGLFQRAVEDSYTNNGFFNLKTLVIAGCKGVLESDLGHLMIVSSSNLESVSIQPSLTRDGLFFSLSFAQCHFPRLTTLHLGYVDKFNATGDVSGEMLNNLGLGEVRDNPASITDSGMLAISGLFPAIQTLSVSNCPHLMLMDFWAPADTWRELRELTLHRCHCLRLPSFMLFLAFLPRIEVVILHDIFREPPKGCSHVGLSAGTGLGMSSAVVSNQEEHIAVAGGQDLEFPPDENLPEEPEEPQEAGGEHLVVLQQEFFDEEQQFANDADGGQNDVQSEKVKSNEEVQSVAVGESKQMEQEIKEDLPLSKENEINPKENTPKRKRSSQKSPHPNQDYLRRKQCKRKSNKGESLVEPSTSEDESNYYIESKKTAANPIKRKCNPPKVTKPPKKCRFVKNFDPNQPSTSKAGNCSSCACRDFDLDNNEASTSNNIRDSSSTNMTFSSEKSSEKLTNKHDTSPLNISKQESKLTKTYKGPVTRCRKRLLNSNMNESQLGDKKVHSSSTLPEPQNMSLNKHEPHMFNCPIKIKEEPTSDSEDNLRRAQFCDSEPSGSQTGPEAHDESHMLPFAPSLKSAKPSDELNANLEPKTENVEEEDLEAFVARRRKLKSTNLMKVGKNRKSKRRKLDNYSHRSEGTQATSHDIRRTLRKHRGCSKRPSRFRYNCYYSPPSSRFNQEPVSYPEEFHHKPKTQHEKQTKSTSTSDPLMEDDAVQVLRLVSETLASLTVLSCGISNIVIDHCHSLTHIEVQACRILKRLELHHCPILRRLNVSQCPKLTMHMLAPEVLTFSSTSDLLFTFEPCMQDYNMAVSENLILSFVKPDLGIVVFHDYSSPSMESSTQSFFRENLLTTMDLIRRITDSATQNANPKKKKAKSKESKGYCMVNRRRGLYSFTPEVPDKWRFDIVTNDTIFSQVFPPFKWNTGLSYRKMGSEKRKVEMFEVVENLTSQCKDGTVVAHKKIVGFYVPLYESNPVTE